MDKQYVSVLSEKERAALRARRKKRRKRRQRRRRQRLFRCLFPLAVVVVVCLFVALGKGSNEQPSNQQQTNQQQSSQQSTGASSESTELVPLMEIARVEPPEDPDPVPETDETVHLEDSLASTYAVLLDLKNEKVLAEKESRTSINPASMTKILTLLVAVEHLSESDLEKTFTMTAEITDYCYENDCSVVGLKPDETVSIRELLYGTILPSGADASLGLAQYISGSQEAFVALMNEKLKELGLSKTSHFTNCVGLYDEEHYSTVYDIGIILKAAMENALCREVLNARTYETKPTAQHPEGQLLSNWFLRRIEDKETGGVTVVGAKTGYVTQAGSCAASGGQDADGNLYICVTGNAASSWQAIYDHVELYQSYCGTSDEAGQSAG